MGHHEISSSEINRRMGNLKPLPVLKSSCSHSSCDARSPPKNGSSISEPSAQLLLMLDDRLSHHDGRVEFDEERGGRLGSSGGLHKVCRHP